MICPRYISDTPTSPDISMNDSSAVYIVWQNKAKDDIFFTGSKDDGASFRDIINLSNNT